jgi:hypothetical protein
VASFRKGRLELAADDPPTEEAPTQGIALQVTSEDFQTQYYAPIQAMLERDPGTALDNSRQIVQIGKRRADTIKFEPLDLTIGLVEERLPKAYGVRFADRPARPAGVRSYLGSDGIFVELGTSWTDEMMRREPQLRMRAGGS